MLLPLTSLLVALLVVLAVVRFHAWLLELVDSEPAARRADRRRWGAVPFALLAVLAVGCATNPVTGKKELAMISEEQELALGRQTDQQVEASIGLYPDADLTAYVARVGKDLASRSERPELPWSFEVVDDPAVNAFALPGGYIYVTRGLLAHLGSEAELAAVLGHEIGHVTARHSVSQISKQQLAGLALGVGMILSPEIRQYGDLAQTGLGLLFLKYGRDDERQSDELGLEYMMKAGYDPREMPGVFTTLERVSQAESGGRGRVPNWLASHPDPGDRRRTAEEAIARLGVEREGRVAEGSYLRAIDGIVFGTNPREGFFEGGTFYHPELAFRLSFPRGWQTVNQKQRVAALSPGKDALIEMTLSRHSSAEQAARELLGQQGVQSGGLRRTEVNGFDGVVSEFAVASQQGEVRGVALFLEDRGRVYQLVGYGTPKGWRASAGEIDRALGSFDRVSDRRVLDVQPRRLDIVELQRAMSVEEFARQYGSSTPVGTLALINQLEPGESLRSGELAKRVVGSGPDVTSDLD
jgi:predicted Zn-dependent protease